MFNFDFQFGSSLLIDVVVEFADAFLLFILLSLPSIFVVAFSIKLVAENSKDDEALSFDDESIIIEWEEKISKTGGEENKLYVQLQMNK
jgi:hypothetical protein